MVPVRLVRLRALVVSLRRDRQLRVGGMCWAATSVPQAMGSLIKKRRKRMRKKKHKKMLKRTRWQRRAK